MNPSEIRSNEYILHAHRFLLRAGLSLAGMFAWVLLFTYFVQLSGSTTRALSGVLLLYVLAQLVTFVVTPVSASHLRRGTKRSLLLGVVFAAASFTTLGFSLSGYFVDPPFWGIAEFAVLWGLYRALYWVPYQLTLVEVKPYHHMHAYLEVFIALMPLFAGLAVVSAGSGYLRLLFGAAALIALSSIPAFFLTNTRERFSWSVPYTFAQLFRRKNYQLVLHSVFEGMQGAALFLLWPIIAFIILEGSYIGLGLIVTLTLLCILLFRRLYAWLLKKWNLRDSTVVYTVVSITGWIARLAAGTPLGIIVADVYAYTTLPRHGTYADAFSFEHGSDRGTFLDEYTALKEMSMAIGRVLLCGTVFFLATAFALPLVLGIALVIAAAASGLSVLVARGEARASY